MAVRRSFLLLLALVFASPVAAQPVPTKRPESTHIFPAGGRRGSTVRVRVGGVVIPPHAGLRIDGAGVTAPPRLGATTTGSYEPSPRRLPTEYPIYYPREMDSTLEIADDAPAGVVWWRITAPRGSTGARPFLVGDLPEFIETESNSTPEKAERITLPITVNGQIAGERDIDYYVFSANENEVVAVETIAARLGSPLEPIVELYDPRGRRVAAEEVRLGTDQVLGFKATVSGDYRLFVANLGVGGGPHYVYRLTVSKAPYVRHAFPPGGRRGTTVEIDFASLGSGNASAVDRRPVELGAALGLWWMRDPQMSFNPVPLVVGDLSESAESEPNDAKGQANHVDFPRTINARFATVSDEDWYRVSCAKGRRYSVTCSVYPPHSSLLPIVTLWDAGEKRLAHKRSVDSIERACRVEWQAQADGDYFVQVGHLEAGSRSGPELIYRLTIEPGNPDFSLSAGQGTLRVAPGAKVELKVLLDRRGGFDGAVDLSLEGLPEGVQAEAVQVPKGKTEATLTFAASETAPYDGAPVRIVGSADIAGKAVRRTLQAPHLGRDREGVWIDRPSLDHLFFTVEHKPLFRITCSEHYQYAHRGTVYLYEMEIERLNGFEGEVFLQSGDQQNRDLDSVRIRDHRVAPGETIVKLPIHLPESMHINVQSQSQIYSQGYAIFKDHKGREQAMTIVAEKRNMLRTLPTVVKLGTREEELIVHRDAPTEVDLQLERTSNFTGPMTVRLQSAPAGVHAEEIQIAAGERSARAIVHVGADAMARNAGALRFVARGVMSGNVEVISETVLPIRITDQ